MIVETWTAFETLSEDLWEVAVNRNPERVLRSSYTKPEKEKQFFMPQKQRLNLPIYFDDFVRASFDLRGKLGTILKSDQQFVFRTYQGIASAYGKAFGKVSHVLDMGKDRSLFDLAQTRNAIVHSAQLVDEQFRQTMCQNYSLYPEFDDLHINDPIIIDGAIVARLIGNAIDAIANLLKDVESELGV